MVFCRTNGVVSMEELLLQEIVEPKEQLQVLRRDGSLVRFKAVKIFAAIEKGFRDTRKLQGSTPEEFLQVARFLTNKVVRELASLCRAGNVLDIELIQDEIERQMMAEGFFDVAKDFIVFRNMRSDQRQKQGTKKEIFEIKGLLEEDSLEFLDLLYTEVLGVARSLEDFEEIYRKYFCEYIQEGVEKERLHKKMLDFDLFTISHAICVERDLELDYRALQTLYKDLLQKDSRKYLETPQILWMRVAMGLAIHEEEKEAKALEFYEVLSTRSFLPDLSLLSYAGTAYAQMLSTYISRSKDDLANIFKTISNDANMSRWSCSISNDWTDVRAAGSFIRGTNSLSQGIEPFLKIANDTSAIAGDPQKRNKNSVGASLEIWHFDVENFVRLGRKRQQKTDVLPSLWIPDLFIRRVLENAHWTLFSPDETGDLHALDGQEFEDLYLLLEQRVQMGQIKLYKRVQALELWRDILDSLQESASPSVGFKDAANADSMFLKPILSASAALDVFLSDQDSCGSSAVQGSLNLAAMIEQGQIEEEKLQRVLKTAVRILDNAIDVCDYPLVELRDANMKTRPIALGIMGFQDALYKKGISYASQQAIEFADESMELISFYTIQASSELAKEKGICPDFFQSKWKDGKLPIDQMKERFGDCTYDFSQKLDWEPIRTALKSDGLRNLSLMAISYSPTIADLASVHPSIEPPYRHMQLKDAGSWIYFNPHLQKILQEQGLWTSKVVNDLKYFEGVMAELGNISSDLKQFFLTIFEIDPLYLIECAARRQKWIDMGQSLRIYMKDTKKKRIDELLRMAWQKGLKGLLAIQIPDFIEKQ